MGWLSVRPGMQAAQLSPAHRHKISKLSLKGLNLAVEGVKSGPPYYLRHLALGPNRFIRPNRRDDITLCCLRSSARLPRLLLSFSLCLVGENRQARRAGRRPRLLCNQVTRYCSVLLVTPFVTPFSVHLIALAPLRQSAHSNPLSVPSNITAILIHFTIRTSPNTVMERDHRSLGG